MGTSPRSVDGVAVPRRMPLLTRPASVLRTLVRRARTSEYVVVGSSARFRATQRRRTIAASRAGFVVIAAAVLFDAVAVFDLEPGNAMVLVALNGSVAILAIVGFLALARGARRRPEPVAEVVTLALTLCTALTGFIQPALAIQTIGYLLLIPGLIALILPWPTRAHVHWLLGYSLIALTYVTLGPNPALSVGDRSDLIVVVVIAAATSMAGHFLLQRAQIRGHAQLQKIQALHRRADADMAELARVHQELTITARLDPLTGAGNRLRLREDLRAARSGMDRSQQNHALIAIDLDHFKLVNDRLGHLAGDAVLKAVVALIQNSIRGEDAIYRFGGEEFLVLLRLARTEDLPAAMERLRCAVVNGGIVHPRNDPSNVVTISLGGLLVTPDDLGQSDDEWFAKADEALYRAKANGRNRAEVAA